MRKSTVNILSFIVVFIVFHVAFFYLFGNVLTIEVETDRGPIEMEVLGLEILLGGEDSIFQSNGGKIYFVFLSLLMNAMILFMIFSKVLQKALRPLFFVTCALSAVVVFSYAGIEVGAHNDAWNAFYYLEGVTDVETTGSIMLTMGYVQMIPATMLLLYTEWSIAFESNSEKKEATRMTIEFTLAIITVLVLFLPLIIALFILGNGLAANKKTALPKGERKKNTLIFDGKKYEIYGEEVRERAHFGKGKVIGYIDGDVVRKPKRGFEQQGEALFTIEE